MELCKFGTWLQLREGANVVDVYYVSPSGRTIMIIGGEVVSAVSILKMCREAGVNAKDYLEAIRQDVSQEEFDRLELMYRGYTR